MTARMGRQSFLLQVVVVTLVSVLPTLVDSVCEEVNWLQVGGGMKTISVSPSGVWATSINNDVHYRVGTYNNPASNGDSWNTTDGRDAETSGCWPAYCLGVDDSGEVYYRNGITANSPSGDSWVKVDGNMTHISVSFHGHVWAVNSSDHVFVRQGASNGNPAGISWKRVDGTMREVSVGSCGVWAVKSNNDVYYRAGTYGDVGSEGTGWQLVGGQMKYVSSGSGVVIGVDNEDKIYVRQGLCAQNPTGTNWKLLNGYLVKVVGYDRKMYWGVNKDGNVYHN